MSPRWEHFEHRADMGVRGFGRTRAEAFEQAALALTAVSVPPEEVEARERISVRCTASDDELLLHEWLSKVVYEMAVRRMLFGRFSVKLDGLRLQADCLGEPVEIARHRPAVEVKAATVTALKVARLPDGTWVAQCVVDV